MTDTTTETKTTTSLSNFNQQNTPDGWQKFGNICLIVGSLGGVVAVLPLSAPIIATISSWVAVAGLLGKVFSKTKGIAPATTDANG